MFRTRVPEPVRDSGYLFIIAAIPGTERITQFWFGNEEFLHGHSVSLWTVYALAALATIAWLFSRRDQILTHRAYIVPVLLIAVSLYTLIRLIVDNELFNLKALVLFLVIILIAIKPPTFEVAKHASITLGLFVLLAAILSLPSAPITVTGMGPDPSGLLYGRPLSVLGVDRWEGPFGNVNYASIAGGMTVLIGLLAQGPLRWFMVAGGSAILLLSQGRASVVALVTALVVLALWSTRVQASPLLRRFLVAIFALAVAVVSALVALGDFSGAGRTYIWPDYVGLGLSSPIFGVGNPGIGEYVQEYEPELVKLGSDWYLMPAFDHGHSIFFDQWARGGLIGLALVGAVLAAIGFFAWRQANAGYPMALAMVTFAAVSGAFETTITWNYLTVLYSPVLISWILSLELREKRGSRRQSAATEGELLAEIPSDAGP